MVRWWCALGGVLCVCYALGSASSTAFFHALSSTVVGGSSTVSARGKRLRRSGTRGLGQDESSDSRYNGWSDSLWRSGVIFTASMSSVAIGVFGVRQSATQRRALRRKNTNIALQATAGGDQTTVETDDQSLAAFERKLAQLQREVETIRGTDLQKVIKVMTSSQDRKHNGTLDKLNQNLRALTEEMLDLRSSITDLCENGNQYASGLETSEVDTMLEVHVVGLSHHSAPVEVREKLAVPEQDWNKYASELVEFSKTPKGYIIPEAAVLSTCNRFELYVASPELDKSSALECVHAFLQHKSGLSREELGPYLFSHSGVAATQHLFEVSSGLDSIVLGEAQILAQVKACHANCIKREDRSTEQAVAGSGGKIVARMLNAGITIGKLVRTKTDIGKGSVSVSSASVELMMSKSMSDLHKHAENTRVCIVGAGKMARLLLIALFSKHPDINVTVVTRSPEKARELLQEVSNRGGSAASVASMEEMHDVVHASDVVFTATGSEVPIISAATLGEVARPLMLVDISVPRNVASDCSSVEGVYSYTVDDLQQVIQANADKRQGEVVKANQFIEEEVKKFDLWQASQAAAPYLASLQAMVQRIRQTETGKMGRLRRLPDNDRRALDKLTARILNQMLEPIYYSMKEEETDASKKRKIWALKKLFQLEPVYKRRRSRSLPGKG